MTSGHEVGPSLADGLGLPDSGALLLLFSHLWHYGCIASHQKTKTAGKFLAQSDVELHIGVGVLWVPLAPRLSPLSFMMFNSGNGIYITRGLLPKCLARLSLSPRFLAWSGMRDKFIQRTE